MARGGGVGSVVAGGLLLAGGYWLYKKLKGTPPTAGTPTAATTSQNAILAALQKLAQSLTSSSASKPSSSGGGGSGAGAGSGGAQTKNANTPGAVGAPTSIGDIKSPDVSAANDDPFASPNVSGANSDWTSPPDVSGANDPLGSASSPDVSAANDPSSGGDININGDNVGFFEDGTNGDLNFGDS